MAGDVEEIVADHAEDAVLITPARVFRGRDGIREAFRGLLAELPEATGMCRHRPTKPTSS
jgi:ketosteroid isomerase-like protein